MNNQTIFFFMKFSSVDWSWPRRASAKLIEKTFVQCLGMNLLRIRSKADLQRFCQSGRCARFVRPAFSDWRIWCEAELGDLVSDGFCKLAVTQLETRWNIRMEFQF
jgi:hypothetical protein